MLKKIWWAIKNFPFLKILNGDNIEMISSRQLLSRVTQSTALAYELLEEATTTVTYTPKLNFLIIP
jgi:hypothetical protein